jgi:hypothetical protein
MLKVMTVLFPRSIRFVEKSEMSHQAAVRFAGAKLVTIVTIQMAGGRLKDWSRLLACLRMRIRFPIFSSVI